MARDTENWWATQSSYVKAGLLLQAKKADAEADSWTREAEYARVHATRCREWADSIPGDAAPEYLASDPPRSMGFLPPPSDSADV